MGEKNELKFVDKVYGIAKSPIVAFLLNILSLVLSFIGLSRFKNDALFLFIFVIPFIATFFLALSLNFAINRILKIQLKENTAFQFIFKKNIKKLLAVQKNSQNVLWNAYNDFCESMDIDDCGPSDGSNYSEIDDKEIKRFYRDIKKASDEIFSATVESLKTIVEYHFNYLKADNYNISVCIKQLNKYYVKKGRQIPNDLHTFAIFRNKDAYDNNREIGKSYTVDANTAFRDCIIADNPREALFIENDIPKAIQEGRYQCENRDELLANNTYTATMVVPITQNVRTEKHFYGYLCIDTISKGNTVFVKDELFDTMQCYADLLATHYHLVSMYFPIIFDYKYGNIE